MLMPESCPEDKVVVETNIGNLLEAEAVKGSLGLGLGIG